MKILLDSDAIIALNFSDQSTHLVAKRIFKKYQHLEADFYTLNVCVQESVTVASKKYSQQEAATLYHNLIQNSQNILHVDIDLELQSWNLFLKQTKKGTSFIDCANLAALSHYNFDKIFSFDQFYPKSIRL